MDSHVFFLSRWLRNPRTVASIAPSSRFLAHAMARSIPKKAGWVVELGGGTGSITKALLANGVPPDNLLVVERDVKLCQYLRKHYPGVRIVNGDACHLPELLQREGISEPVRAVVSGLPIRIMEHDQQLTIMRSAFQVMEKDGLFIQFTYSLFCPATHKVRGQLGLKAHCVGQVWKNLPPAKLWSFRQANAA
jgi:phosphatidylethanolamine/phosphatidyl-N-methylethanolamine N-methyltransferase